MDNDTQMVFSKIRELSAECMEPRPYIAVGELEQELKTNISVLGKHLVYLKKMRLIIFNRKMMTAIKLTQLGLFLEQKYSGSINKN